MNGARLGLKGSQGVHGAQGPAGTAGPANLQRFAHVIFDGTVDPEKSEGIDQSNVHLIDTMVTGSHEIFYCFSGFGDVKGAHITLDVNQLPTDDNEQQITNATAYFSQNENSAECDSIVTVYANGNYAESGFYIYFY